MESNWDLNVLRSIVTLISMLVFLGIAFWAYSKRNKHAFDDAASLPLLDERPQEPEIPVPPPEGGETTWGGPAFVSHDGEPVEVESKPGIRQCADTSPEKNSGGLQ